MEKITKSSDKVLIDPNEPLILPDGTALVGRVEWFLYALCCLDYQNLPTPMSRIEEFANALITGEVPNIEPQSRAEQFFLAILDGNVSDLPQPQSRSEVLLDKLARGEFDLSDVEPIQSRYELLLAYLIKNGGIGNIDYVLYEFSEAMKTMYNTVEKPFKSLELSGNTLVNCVLEDTENDDYTSFDKDYSGTSFTINGTSEGAIKSAILKGNTLVNLSENLTTITRSLDWWYREEKLVDNIEKLKRNTYYTVLYRLENISGNHENYNGIGLGIGENAFDKDLPDIAGALDKNGGWCKIRFQLTDDFIEQYPSYKQLHIRPIRRATAPVDGEYIQYTIRGFAILEGDYITNPIPFNEVFEGMQSVKMPVLTTNGKNLFDIKQTPSFINYVDYNIDVNNGAISITQKTDTTNGRLLGFKVYLKKGKTYTYKATFHNPSNNNIYLRFRNEDRTVEHMSSSTNIVDGNCTLNFTWNQNNGFGYVFLYNAISGTQSNLNSVVTWSNIQFEEGSVATTYEPYKSNILTVNEPVELRGIGDVKDTLDCLTGEVTERIGEVILDGSESWNIHSYSNDDFLLIYTDIANKKTKNILCDKLPTWNGTAEDLRNQTQSYIWANTNKSVFVWLEKSKLSEATEQGFKDYLQSNPIILHYQLATESIKTVDLNVVDQNNTKIDKIHVFNETTHVNASSDELTPTVNISKSVSYPTIIKPNTKYAVDLKRNDKPLTVNLGGTEVTFVDGETRKTITTPSTLTNDKLSYYGIGAKCNEIMLIEGEIERNIDYFTGMQSVEMQNQMPILHTVGKNLFDGILKQGYLADATGESVSKLGLHSINYIKCSPNSIYTISGTLNNLIPRFYFYDSDKKYLGNDIGINNYMTYTAPSNACYMRFRLYSQEQCDITLFNAIQVEESSIATSYEPYKSSILSLPKEIVLRSLPNGVCDTFNTMTGEYIQRIGEIVVDLTESDYRNLANDGMLGQKYMAIRFPKMKTPEGVSGLLPQTAIANILPIDNPYGSVTWDCCGVYMNYVRLYIHEFTTQEEYDTWISQNNLVIQYKLETPIIKTVDLNVVDQDGNTIPKIKSYKDVTHLEVTVPKQSLLPNISAEVATDNSKDMSSLTTKHQEISEAQSAIQNSIQSQSDEIDTAMMATTEIFESILE